MRKLTFKVGKWYRYKPDNTICLCEYHLDGRTKILTFSYLMNDGFYSLVARDVKRSEYVLVK